MDNADKQAFMAVMTGMAENFGQTVTTAGVALRFEALKGFDIESVKAAAMSILGQRKYTTMPTVADFLEHLGGGSVEDKAEVAAGKLLQVVAEVGCYKSLVFDDPVLMAVVESGFGGWPKLCGECNGKDERFLRKEIAKTYAAYARQGQRKFGHLSGILENENGSAGRIEFIPEPVLVGDKATAFSVLQQGESRAALDSGQEGLPHLLQGLSMGKALPYDCAAM